MQYHAKKWFNIASVNAMAAIAIGAMLVFSVSGMKAFADEVNSNIVETNTQSTTVNEGDTVTIKYWIAVQGGGVDGQGGCNFGNNLPSGGKSTATINLAFDTSILSGPTSLTFTGCNEGNAKTATFDAIASGNGEVKVSSVSDNDPGSGTYVKDGATVTITVEEDAPPTPTDTTAPVVKPNIDGTEGNDGWYTSDVEVTWTVIDAESTITSKSQACDETTTIDQDTDGQTITCEATSAGGTTKESVTIKRDATKPEITVNSDISNGQEFYFGDVPSEPKCDATDATSGVDGDGCQVSGYGTAVGSYTLKFTANDNAGNTETQEITYTVLPWTIKGFYQPVDMNGVTNVVKAGSTVPLKFEVFKGSTELTDISVRDTVTQKKVTCDTGAPVDEIEQYTTTGQTTFRYDSSSGQFIDNWKSPTTKNACYQVTMTFDDGSSVAALFRTK